MVNLRKKIAVAALLAPLAAMPAHATNFASNGYGAAGNISTNGSAVNLTIYGNPVSASGSTGYSTNSGGYSAYVYGNLAADPNKTGSYYTLSNSEAGSKNVLSSDGSSSGQAQFTGNAGGFNLTDGNNNNLFSLTWSTANSISSAGLNGSNFATSGSTSLTGVSLSGSLVANPFSNVDYNNAAANTVLYSLNGLRVLLNEQLLTTTANGSQIQTNAVHVFFNNFALGNSRVTGDALIGHTDSTVGSVPEPATWATMLVGMGLIGATLRRIRGLAALTA